MSASSSMRPRQSHWLNKRRWAVACLLCLVFVVLVLARPTEQTSGGAAAFELVQRPIRASALADGHAGMFLRLSGDGSTLVTSEALNDFPINEAGSNLVVFTADRAAKRWVKTQTINLPGMFYQATVMAVDYSGSTIVVGIGLYKTPTVQTYARTADGWSLSDSLTGPFSQGQPLGIFGTWLEISRDASTLMVGMSYNSEAPDVGPILVYNRLNSTSWVFDSYVFRTPSMGQGISFTMSPDARMVVVTLLSKDYEYGLRSFVKTAQGTWQEYSLPVDQSLYPFSRVINLVLDGKYLFLRGYHGSDIGAFQRNDHEHKFDHIGSFNLTMSDLALKPLDDSSSLIINEDATMLVCTITARHQMVNGELKGLVIPFEMTKSIKMDGVAAFELSQRPSPIVAQGTDDPDLIRNFGTTALLSDDASTLVVTSGDDSSLISRLFFFLLQA